MPTDALQPGEHFAGIRGARLRYIVRGAGPALVVLPGGAGWGGDLTPYLETLGPLETLRTVVYLEPRGLGRSERKPGPTGYNLAEYSADVAALREHLGLDRLELLGHSHGGFVALLHAAEHPDRVQRLILVGTTPTLALGDRQQWLGSRPGAAEAGARAAALAGRTDLTPDDRHRATLEALLPVIHFHHYPSVAATFERWLRDMTISVEPFQAFMAEDAPKYDLRPLLGRISALTLVIAGEDEMPEMMLGSRLLAQGIPNARLSVLAACGHWPMIESPAALFDAIRGFLGAGLEPSAGHGR